MTDLEPKEADEKCNARKTDGSGYCGHTAGWGTDHPGHGRCKYHGGNTPSGEKTVLDDLEGAAEHAGLALKLQIKQMRRKLENGEDVDPSELDRLARTILDRTGHGPSETRELEHEGDAVQVIADFSPDE